MSKNPTALRRLNGEIIRFLFVGGTAALLDLMIYAAFLLIGVPSFAAKLASFVLSGIAAYFAHHHITFRRKSTRHVFSLSLFFSLYGITLAINVSTNELLLAWLHIPGSMQFALAWAGATFLSSIMNFIGGKLLVFREVQ